MDGGSGVKVLVVVEDHDFLSFPRYFRKRVCALLQRHGYEVLEARDGQEGFRMARREVPHLVIMDLNMPRSDSAQVARTMSRDPVTSRLPVVYLTSRSWEAPGSGNHCLAKPFQDSDLLAAVAEALGEAGIPPPAAPPRPLETVEELSPIPAPVPPAAPPPPRPRHPEAFRDEYQELAARLDRELEALRRATDEKLEELRRELRPGVDKEGLQRSTADDEKATALPFRQMECALEEIARNLRDQLREHGEEFREHLGELFRGLEERFTSRLEEQDQRLEQLAQDTSRELAGIDQKFEALGNSSAEELDRKLAVFARRSSQIKALEKQLQGLGADRLRVVEGKLEEVEKGLAELRADMANLADRLERLYGSFRALATELGRAV